MSPYNVDDIDPKEWMVPPQCIPVHANVVTYDWSQLSDHTEFDVIMMDPPWRQGLTLLHISAQHEPLRYAKLHQITPHVPQKVLTSSRKVDDLKLVHFSAQPQPLLPLKLNENSHKECSE